MSAALTERALLASIHIGGTPSSMVQNASTTSEVQTQKHLGRDSGKWMDRLYPPKFFDPVYAIDREARAFHRKLTSPWKDDGARILPTEHFTEHSDGMRQRRSAYFKAVSELVAKLPDAKAWAKAELNGSYDESRYPSPEEFTAAFYFNTPYDPIESADDFRVKLTDEQIAEVKASAEQATKERLTQSQGDVWRRLAEPIMKLLAHLKGETEADCSAAQLLNLRETVRYCAALNIADDPVLDAVLDEINVSLVPHVATVEADRKIIRRSETMRVDVRKKAEQIAAKMAAYV